MNDIQYKERNGIFFHAQTDESICYALSKAKERGQRLRLWYGDIETGKAWHEEYDTMGYIGRSTGAIKIPLLLNNAASIGGGAILDHCIIAITAAKGGAVLYKHPKFNQGEWDIIGAQVLCDGETYAHCKDERQARRLADFMSGRRNSK
jgi:hypothetical protein